MTNHEWLERAITFDLGHCIFYKRPVYIEARDQADGNRLWVLKMERSDCWVLGKDGEFHWEPMPSSRTDAFIANTRWDNPEQVHSFWKDVITEAKPLYIE